MPLHYTLAVVIGRFQIPHQAHIELIEFAATQADHVLVIIGSVNQPRTIKNPFTYAERSQMLLDAVCCPDQLILRGLEDRIYNDTHWSNSVRSMVTVLSRGGSVALIGHHKDASSFYLDLFPEYALVEFPPVRDLSSTQLRQQLFEQGQPPAGLPTVIHTFLSAFIPTEAFERLLEEYRFIQSYHQSWAAAPYPPTFITADAVVVCSGHLLLVRRRALPGRGLLALPGGFVGPEESVESAVLRELKEESRIKVPLPVLKGSIRYREIFDNPQRSLRGRTITVAYLLELAPEPNRQLPKVRGGDDAAHALWMPLNEVLNAREQLFEDHFDIIFKMTGGI